MWLCVNYLCMKCGPFALVTYMKPYFNVDTYSADSITAKHKEECHENKQTQ